MQYIPLTPPRRFPVGQARVVISDVGRISLDPDEQVTFTTPRGAEYDVARKSFGFYATPSLNGRLPQHGLRPALIGNDSGQYFVMLVEPDLVPDFEQYCALESQTVRAWLDDNAVLDRLFGVG